MPFPSAALPQRGTKVLARSARVVAVVLALSCLTATGLTSGGAQAHPALSVLQQPADLNTLRVYGYPVVSNPHDPAASNGPATAGRLVNARLEQARPVVAASFTTIEWGLASAWAASFGRWLARSSWEWRPW